VAFLFCYPKNGREQSNATDRWTVAQRQLDGADTIIPSPPGRKCASAFCP